MPTNKPKRIWVLTPVLGTLLFIVLYGVATCLYPGGSQFDKNAVGFSWVNNYWCNLLNDRALNGQPNPAQPVAVAGMIVLGITLSLFWILFPVYVKTGKFAKLSMQISGPLAMLTALFLVTSLHDTVTNLASFFGLVATVGTFTGLYKNGWFGLFAFGLFNVLLVGLNNYVYYTKGLIIYLPVVQKISFATFLIWVCCIAIRLFRSHELVVKPSTPRLGPRVSF